MGIKKLKILMVIAIVILMPSKAYSEDGYVDDATVIKWGENAISSIMSMDHSNLEDKKIERRLFFTDKGYKDFNQALYDSRLLEMLASEKMEMIPYVLCDPSITSKSVETLEKSFWDFSKDTEEIDVWKLKSFVKFQYKTAAKSRDNYMVVELVIHNGVGNDRGSLYIDRWIQAYSSKESSLCSGL